MLEFIIVTIDEDKKYVVMVDHNIHSLDDVMNIIENSADREEMFSKLDELDVYYDICNWEVDKYEI